MGIDLDKQQIEEQLKLQRYKKEIDDIMKEEQRKQREIEIKQHQQLLIDKDNDYEEVIEELFECVVCNKIFKSQNAFNTHESSKKHIKELENLKFQLNIENELLFNGNDDNELKVNDQNNVDQMIAKQIAHQQNVDNDDNEDGSDKQNNDKPLNLDYLLALTMEQEDIINSADLFDDDMDNNNDDDIESNRNALITDSEIIALLEQPGIDIDALINTYPSLTRQYIITLKNKT